MPISCHATKPRGHCLTVALLVFISGFDLAAGYDSTTSASSAATSSRTRAARPALSDTEGAALCDVSSGFDIPPASWTCTGGLPDADICAPEVPWEGVFCNPEGSVESISYTCSPGDVLGGILHPSVGTLANMTTLYIFGGCEVGGPLPAEVTKLSNLRVLTLWSNKFTGALPPLNDKDRFPFLYSLNVKKNAFSGAALDFRNSTGLLKVYEFGDNLFEGPLPCAPASATTYNAAGNPRMEYCYQTEDCPEEPANAAIIYPAC